MELIEKMHELREKNDALKEKKANLDTRKQDGEEHIVSNYTIP